MNTLGAMMPNSSHARTLLIIDGAYIVVVAVSFLLPRLLRSSEGGFAPAGGAVLLFLLLFSIASVLAVVGCVIAIRHRQVLGMNMVIIGVLPMMISAAFFVWLFFSLMY